LEPPTHPDQDDDQSPTTINWPTVLAIAAVTTVVATLIILHLTGIVGPAG
jgi:hypothetical protein